MTFAESARRIALLHPATLTAAFAAGFLAWAIASNMAVAPVVLALCGALAIGSLCGWNWAVFVVSARPANTTPGWAHLIYVAPPVLVFVALIAGWSTHNSPTAFVFFALLLLGLWRAADALEKASTDTGKVGAGQIIATTLLMYFAFVAVWVLRDRIQRAAASPP